MNDSHVSPQEEYRCQAGERVSVCVRVTNRLPRALRRVRLSAGLYQDYNNGALNYALDNRVATAGNNKYAHNTALHGTRLVYIIFTITLYK